MPDTPILVACLCADWCGTCRDYLALFTQMQREFPAAKFIWVDVEDHADLVDPIEVDNFPTLLIAAHGEPRFFGTVTPHIDTLRRLIQSHSGTDSHPATHTHAVHGLVLRLRKAITTESI
jgi:thiol-disulfide isomerase/thioredoxin